MQTGDYYFAKTIADLLQQINAVPDAHVRGGCTLDHYLPPEDTELDDEPAAITVEGAPARRKRNIYISIRGIKELSQIIRHERYIDCGPAVTLADLLKHRGGHVPSVLVEGAQSIGNPFVRNLATIGGNVASFNHCRHYMTLYAPLLALDAKIELKSRSDTRFVPLAAFTVMPKEYIISNIRIPLDDWDVAILRRLPPTGLDRHGASFAFLASTEKRLISNVRLAFAGHTAFRSLETENKAIGMRLPLTPKDVDGIVQEAAASFKTTAAGKESGETASRFCYLTRQAFEHLT